MVGLGGLYDQACAVGLRLFRNHSIRTASDRFSSLWHAFDLIGLGFLSRRVRRSSLAPAIVPAHSLFGLIFNREGSDVFARNGLALKPKPIPICLLFIS